MNTLALALLLGLCAGCGSMPTFTKTEIVRAEVGVPVPCKIAKVEEPAWPIEAVDPNADPHTLAKNALAEVERRRQYELQLKAAIVRCQ